MAYKKNRSSFILDNAPHFAKTFLLELSIAHSQYFINDEDLALEMRSHCKCKAHIHPAAVSFYGCINVSLHPCKIHDLIELSFNLFFLHAEDGAIHKNIFTPGKFRIESCSY